MPKALGMEMRKQKLDKSLEVCHMAVQWIKAALQWRKQQFFISACSMSNSANDSVYILLGFTVLILAC